MKDQVTQIIDQFKEKKREYLIPVLQQIQDKVGFLSQESLLQVSESFNIPATKIYGVASFYNQFRFHGIGRFHIQVCRGTACHVKGSAAVFEELKRTLKIDSNQTTKDGLFSLEVVACIGACGLAPVMCINGEYFGGVTPEKVRDIIADYKKQTEEN